MKTSGGADDHDERGEPTATTRGGANEHHPPPASRATARGVDRGWNHDERRRWGERERRTATTVAREASPTPFPHTCARAVFFFLSSWLVFL